MMISLPVLDPERVRDVLVALLQVIPTLLIAYAVLERPVDRVHVASTATVVGRIMGRAAQGPVRTLIGPRARSIVVALAAVSGLVFCVIGALVGRPGIGPLGPPLAATVVILVEMALSAYRQLSPQGLKPLAELWVGTFVEVVTLGGLAIGVIGLARGY